MFKDALETMEPNLPCEYAILLRCSERSIANINIEAKHEDTGQTPSGSVSFQGETIINR